MQEKNYPHTMLIYPKKNSNSTNFVQKLLLQKSHSAINLLKKKYKRKIYDKFFISKHKLFVFIIVIITFSRQFTNQIK